MLHLQHDLSKPPFLLSAALVKVGSILPFAAVVASVRFKPSASSDRQSQWGGERTFAASARQPS